MLTRKYVIARAELIDVELREWVAESRAGSGTWVVRSDDNGGGYFGDFGIVGACFKFDEETSPGQLLRISGEGLAQLGMSAHVLAELNALLAADYAKRESQ